MQKANNYSWDDLPLPDDDLTIHDISNSNHSLDSDKENLNRLYKESKDSEDKKAEHCSVLEEGEQLKREWCGLHELEYEIKANQKKHLAWALKLVPRTEELKKLLKKKKKFKAETFYLYYVGKSDRTYRKYRLVYDNWDWLEDTNPVSINQCTHRIKKKEQDSMNAAIKEQEIQKDTNLNDLIKILRCQLKIKDKEIAVKEEIINDLISQIDRLK